MLAKEILYNLQDELKKFAETDMLEKAEDTFDYIKPRKFSTNADVIIDGDEFFIAMSLDMLNDVNSKVSCDTYNTCISDKRKLDFLICGKEVEVELWIDTYEGNKYGLQFKAIKQFFDFCLAKIEKSVKEIIGESYA